MALRHMAGIVAVALAMLFSAAHIQAAGYDAGFQFIEEPTDARSVAMGSAGAAFESHGFGHYNPAKPGLARERYLSVEYGQQSGELRRGSLEAAWMIGPKWFAALSIPTSTISDIQAADERGALPMYFSSQGTMLALASGYTWRGLTVALCLHGIQERIDVNTGYALSVSAGATYWILQNRLSVGAAGFFPKTLTANRDMITKEWGDDTPVNRAGRAGVAWRDSLRSVRYAAALDIVYNDALESVTVPIGLEVWPVRQLALRAGTRINHETDLFSVGLGVRLEPLTVDAAFTTTRWVEDAGVKWLVNIGYTIRSAGSSSER